MSRRASSDIELNFDGLTDSLTNIVGTLILFVFLLFVRTTENTMPGVASGFLGRTGGSRAASDLLHEVTRLEAELKSLETQVAQQEGAIPQLRKRIETVSTKGAAAP